MLNFLPGLNALSKFFIQVNYFFLEAEKKTERGSFVKGVH